MSVDRSEVSQDDIDKNKVKDISRQLVESESGKKLDIMLGGGRASFLPWSRKPKPANRTELTPPGFDYEDENDMWENYRDDGRNLLDEWENLSGKRKYIDSLDQLLAKNLTDADKVMGEHSNPFRIHHFKCPRYLHQLLHGLGRHG